MPSGSTRLTVTSLYSFPLTVLKSSANTTGPKHRMNTMRTFIFVLVCLYFDRRGSVLKNTISGQAKLRGSKSHAALQQNRAPILVKQFAERWTLHLLLSTCEPGCAQFLQ